MNKLGATICILRTQLCILNKWKMREEADGICDSEDI